MVVNLVSNAIKFTSAAGSTDAGSILDGRSCRPPQ
jgi:signal transduction histidine kinase